MMHLAPLYAAATAWREGRKTRAALLPCHRIMEHHVAP